MSLIFQRLVNSRLYRLRCRWGCARYPEVSGYALNHAVIIYAARPVLRTICSAAQGGHTGWPFFAYIKNGKVEIVEDIEDTISISIDKLNHTQ